MSQNRIIQRTCRFINKPRRKLRNRGSMLCNGMLFHENPKGFTQRLTFIDIQKAVGIVQTIIQKGNINGIFSNVNDEKYNRCDSE